MPISKYKESFLIFLFCSFGCASCWLLQLYTGWPAYLASIVVGLIGSFIPQSSIYDRDQCVACIYSGSFAGMCSLSFFVNNSDILLLCFLVGTYFNIFKHYLNGLGGKLGTIGFFASISFALLRGLL